MFFLDFFYKIVTLLIYGSEEERIKQSALKKLKQKLEMNYSQLIASDSLVLKRNFVLIFIQLQKVFSSMQRIIEPFTHENNRDTVIGIITGWNEENGRKLQNFKSSDFLVKEFKTMFDADKKKHELEEEINQLNKSFLTTEYMHLNDAYTNLQRIIDLSRFNFMDILLAFDDSASQDKNNSSSHSSLVPLINLEIQLQDFYYLAYALDFSEDLDKLISIITKLSPPEEISLEMNYEKLKDLLENELNETFFTISFQLLHENSEFKLRKDEKKVFFLEEFLDHEISFLYSQLENVYDEMKEERINTKCHEFWPDFQLPTIEGYDDTMKNIIHSNGYSGFHYIRALQIIRMFLAKNLTNNIHDTLNKMLMEGDFVKNSGKVDFSQTYYRTMEWEKPVSEFESYMTNINNPDSSKNLRNLVSIKVEGLNQGHLANKIISKIDNKAGFILNSVLMETEKLISYLSLAINDYKSEPKQFLRNINHLDGDKNKFFMMKLMNNTKELIQFRDLLVLFHSEIEEPK